MYNQLKSISMDKGYLSYAGTVRAAEEIHSLEQNINLARLDAS